MRGTSLRSLVRELRSYMQWGNYWALASRMECLCAAVKDPAWHNDFPHSPNKAPWGERKKENICLRNQVINFYKNICWHFDGLYRWVWGYWALNSINFSQQTWLNNMHVIYLCIFRSSSFSPMAFTHKFVWQIFLNVSQCFIKGKELCVSQSN